VPLVWVALLLILFILLYYFILFVLRIKPRVSHMLSVHCTSGLYRSPIAFILTPSRVAGQGTTYKQRRGGIGLTGGRPSLFLLQR
jgi:hypothetical protein